MATIAKIAKIATIAKIAKIAKIATANLPGNGHTKWGSPANARFPHYFL